MHLYGLTIQRSAAINCAVYGNFSKAKVDEVIVSHGKTLELYRVDESGKIHSVVCTDVFGLIRDIKPFRLTGPSGRAEQHAAPEVAHLASGAPRGRWRRAHSLTLFMLLCPFLLCRQYA